MVVVSSARIGRRHVFVVRLSGFGSLIWVDHSPHRNWCRHVFVIHFARYGVDVGLVVHLQGLVVVIMRQMLLMSLCDI